MFTIDELLKATGGQITQGPLKGIARHVSIDSRKVKKGDVFIAVKGDIFDGHDFLENVIALGVRVIIVHKSVQVRSLKVSVIRVKDTTRALGDVARFHRLRFKAPVIALTGSAGKTTIKEMIAAVLAKRYNVLKNEGTQNNHIGVPLTLLKLRSTHQIVVLECGTNQPGDIPWLADIARPDAVVFTNIGESHLERLKNKSGVLKEKWALTSFLSKGGSIIVNTDDPYLGKQTKKARTSRIISYGINTPAKFKAGKIMIKDGRRLEFKIGQKAVELNSCGVNNVYNALGAYACGALFKVPAASIIKALKEFEFPKGRGRIVPLGRGWMVDDTYNANPVSMRSALETLEMLKVDGQRIFIAADMLELGSQAKALHHAFGRRVARSSIDVLITVGRLAKSIAAGARHKKTMDVFACKDQEGAQKAVARVLRNGDAVLIKGSRRMKMEQMVDFLLASPGKGR